MPSYVGLDVSLAETSVCVLDDKGRVRFEGRVASRPEALVGCLRSQAGDAERVAIETGQTVGLLYRALKAAGFPVLCLETRHAHRALSARTNKTDRNDARGLAELMRVGWYREAHVRGADANAVRSLLLGRKLLMQTKRTLENSLRGGVKRFGLIVSKTSGRTFQQRAIAVMSRNPAFAAFAAPLIQVLKTVLEQMRDYDRRLMAIARQTDVVRRLMTVPSIGYLTALAFFSTVEEPTRFKSSADIGPYLGLTPRVFQSDEMDRSGRITRTGDAMTRSYLVEAANVLLTRVKRPVALQSWGRKLADRAGMKKAQVAVARKLAVMLHAIWTDGTEFEGRSATA